MTVAPALIAAPARLVLERTTRSRREDPIRESFDNLLRQYEDGTLTRRQVLGAITALAVPARAGAQPGRFRARSLHHVNVGVTDVAQSETFYRTLLGVPARRYIVGDVYALDLPDGGLISLCPTQGGNCSLPAAAAVPGQIDHFGVGIRELRCRTRRVRP